MAFDQGLFLGFAAALGGGLLIGIERERRKGFGTQRAFAGVRTFTLASLLGAAVAYLGQPLLTFAGGLLVIALAAIEQWRVRARDPGVTTELALFLTYLLGLIALHKPVISAGGAIVVAGLLASRRALHNFSVEILTESELRDGLLFAACALIVLPLLPDAPTGWLAGGSPRRIFALVVTFMGLQSAGHIALRMAGPRLGLSLSGLVSGFISSTGTIASLGSRARADRQLLSACVSGAFFSTIATVVLLAIVVAAVHAPALTTLAPSLIAALVTVLAAAGLSLWLQPRTTVSDPAAGRPFNLLQAVGFAAILAGVTAGMGVINRYYGQIGASVAAGIAGIFDVHAAAASALALAAKGTLDSRSVVLPVLIAISTNTGSKVVAAFVVGGMRYGTEVAAGLICTAAAAWAPVLWFYLSGLHG